MIPRLDSSAWLWPLILLALILRLWGLQEQSFTTDEVFELHQARLSASDIVVAEDGFPPLYGLSLRGWLGVLGSDQHARLLSVLLGCLAIPVMWWMAPYLGAVRSSFWPTFLLAISPFHIWYSQEARAYPLFFLAAVLSIWTCLRALDGDSKRAWLPFIGASILGMLTHYWFILVLFCLGTIVLVERRSWKTLRLPVAAFSAVGLLALPLLPLLRQDLGSRTAYFTPSRFHLWELGRTFYSLLAGYSLGPSIREVRILNHGQALIAFLPWILLLGSCAILLGYFAIKSLLGTRHLARMVVLLTPSVIICGVVGNILGIGYHRAYVAWVAAPVLVLLGIGIEGLTSRVPRRLMVSTLCLLSAVSLYQRIHSDKYREPDTRAVSQYLATHNDRGLPVFVTPWYNEEPLRYYMGEDIELAGLPVVQENGSHLNAAMKQMRTRAFNTSSFWLLYGEAVDGDPGGWLLKTLSEKGAVVREARFAGLDLYVGDVEKLGGR